MAPPVLVKPPIEGQDPHKVWEEYVLLDLSERLESLTQSVENLTENFRAHMQDEMEQYRLVGRNLDRLFSQTNEFHDIALEFKQCRREFDAHVDNTKKDHENARFFFRLAMWVGSALLFIAANYQVVFPLFSRVIGSGTGTP